MEAAFSDMTNAMAGLQHHLTNHDDKVALAQSTAAIIPGMFDDKPEQKEKVARYNKIFSSMTDEAKRFVATGCDAQRQNPEVQKFLAEMKPPEQTKGRRDARPQTQPANPIALVATLAGAMQRLNDYLDDPNARHQLDILKDRIGRLFGPAR